MYGENLTGLKDSEDSSVSSSSSNGEEDDEGMLIDSKLETKFMEVFSGLRNKDPTILNAKANLFDDFK